MHRKKLEELIAWKNSTSRKPLIIKGARQVGKTWLMKEFGTRHYQKTVYINFEKDSRLRTLFTDDFDIKRRELFNAKSNSRICTGETR